MCIRDRDDVGQCQHDLRAQRPAEQHAQRAERQRAQHDQQHGPRDAARGRAPAQEQRGAAEDQHLDGDDGQCGGDAARDEEPAGEGGGEALEDAVAAVEAEGDGLAGERRRQDREGEDAGGGGADPGVGHGDDGHEGERDEQRHRDQDGEQDLLAVPQRQQHLHARLREEHPAELPPARRGRERAGGEPGRRRHRVSDRAAPGHERSSRPVSSRNTSSRLRLATISSSASTPCCAHQEVTVETTCGSMRPSTR